jgi:hypothetical protein
LSRPPIVWGFALLLAACSEPAPAEISVSLVSDEGLFDAHVSFAGPIERGDNALLVELHPRERGEAHLLAVDATMAAHGHEAHAAAIDRTEVGFRAQGLDLYMTGRWLVSLDLQLGERDDNVSLPVDVP